MDNCSLNTKTWKEGVNSLQKAIEENTPKTINI